MKEIVRYPGCIVCGEKNEIGFKARFFWDGEKAVCDIVAQEQFAGYKNIFHGGMVATILDEVMIKAILAEDEHVVTAEMTVRYKKPVNIGDKIHFEGWKTNRKRSIFFTEGRAINQNGDVVAEATGKYIKPKSDLANKLLESLE